MISFYSYNCISRYESNKIIFIIIYFIIIIIYLLNLNSIFHFYLTIFIKIQIFIIFKLSLNQFNISILLLFYLIYVSKKIATKLRQVNKIILYFYIPCLSMLWNRYSCICQQNVHASGEWQNHPLDSSQFLLFLPFFLLLLVFFLLFLLSSITMILLLFLHLPLTFGRCRRFSMHWQRVGGGRCN